MEVPRYWRLAKTLGNGGVVFGESNSARLYRAWKEDQIGVHEEEPTVVSLPITIPKTELEPVR